MTIRRLLNILGAECSHCAAPVMRPGLCPDCREQMTAKLVHFRAKRPMCARCGKARRADHRRICPACRGERVAA